MSSLSIRLTCATTGARIIPMTAPRFGGFTTTYVQSPLVFTDAFVFLLTQKYHHQVAEDLHGGEWLFAWNPRDEHNLTVDSNFVDTKTYICSSKTCTVMGTVVVNRTRRPPEPWPVAAVAIMDAAGVRPSEAHPGAAHACKDDRA
eukprot:SAG11_NODE_189_length_13028_cov_14.222446_2_plen_145_part_00